MNRPELTDHTLAQEWHHIRHRLRWGEAESIRWIATAYKLTEKYVYQRLLKANLIGDTND